MTELRIELAFVYRDSAEKERRLATPSNWRSFTGIQRKWNAGWWVGRSGVLRFRGAELRNAGWWVTAAGQGGGRRA